jgi:uncharacterized protein (TIGR00369 family)
MPAGGAALTAQLRVEFIRPLQAGYGWIEGRAEADAVDDDTGLARAEIVDEADQLLGVASLRIMKTSLPYAQPATAAAVASRRADSGQSDWTFRPPPAAANSYGMLHGGVLGLVAHEVASDAIRSAIGPGEDLLPLDLVLNFYRGVPVSAGDVTATARVTHRGRRFVVAEGEVAGPEGRRALRLSVGAHVRAASGA